MAETPTHLRSGLLGNAPGVRHGFFGRLGGVSSGVYTSLNTGLGSGDAADSVTENRARCASALGVEPNALVTNRQIHSNRVIVVDNPEAERQQADALVTNQPGIALGVLAADCIPCLMADPIAGVIGAAHAGWRGSLAGIIEATAAQMIALGAKPDHMMAAIGHCLRQPNFEVGLDLVEAFTSADPQTEQFFSAGASSEKRQFDHAGFARGALARSGVTMIDDLNLCTLANPSVFFSYRQSGRDGAEDYGRNLSAIALDPAHW